ncbi:MAG: hypothetical protein M3Y26_02490 [Actinomycetota bacterium]|nr:hypothetical protein [Actinomycetota bacterium]
MTTIDDYLHRLQRLLHVRGRMRRRLLTECRDHLQDASAQYGPEEAVRRFGTAEDIAASLNTEVAARQAQHATVATVLGVLAVAGSTLALLHSSDTGATAPAGWAIAFFAAAQTAAVCAALATLQAAALRRRHTTAPDVALLCRRNACALVAAGVTLFAAGGAVPGQGSPVLLLAGPVLAAMAGLSVLGTRSIIRGLPAARQLRVRSPLTDLGTLSGLTLPHVQPARLLPPTIVVASVTAFVWDHADHGTFATALTTAGIQAMLVVLGFLLLGPALGLRPRRHLT